MTPARARTRRTAFTLVELLVGMSIILALAGLTLLVYPTARDQDRVKLTVGEVQATLKLAQGMAARDKAPRGVRFIVAGDPNNVDKTDVRWVTELQYIEQPPPLIPNRNPLTTNDPTTEPRVAFRYTVAPGPNPAAGTITTRQCVIQNLLTEDANQVQAGSTLVMPVLGAWSKIVGLGPRTAATGGRVNLEVTLEVYPDAVMGASTHLVTYHFSIYLLATPLVGEPTVLLPKDICVDLNPSVPSWAGRATHFEVLFAPDGKLLNSPGGGGQLFLWVRNYTKPAPYTTNPFAFLSGAPLSDALRRGGDQYIVGVRSSGVVGNNEVALPDAAGNYPSPQAPYALAQQELR